MIPAISYLGEASRLLVLVVLASAAWTKTADLDRFAAALVDHFRVPARVSKPFAVVVAGLEWLAAALLLAGGAWMRGGLVLAALLLLTFTAVLAEAVLRGRRVHCSCFGRSRHPVSPLDLARNAFYLLACGIGLGAGAPPVAFGLTVQAALLLAAVYCYLVSAHLEDLRQLR